MFRRLPAIMGRLSVLLFVAMLSFPGVPGALAEEAVPAAAEAPSSDTVVARKTFETLSETSAKCASCHEKDNHGLYQQWGRSKHYGANVGCYECHRAEPGDADAVRHKDAMISILVSPKDCGRCHEKEYKQFETSNHAHAADMAGSPSYHMGHVVQGDGSAEGNPASMQGCTQCHGSVVKVAASGKLDPATWPNSGIGRVNPDGSKGACSACHQRHEFSIGQARRPESCGKCHRGPAHPQMEIYSESKHGINFIANADRMNLDRPKWIPGEDYDSGPTCSTCHMSATRSLPLTHNTGERISWTLRPPVSVKVDAHEQAEGKQDVVSWEDRRDTMQEVCMSCHSERLVENFYKQYDAVVMLYNSKFAEPGVSLMGLLRETGLISGREFDDTIEWTWYRLWNMAGSRARQGAAMLAPSYIQGEGLFEVSSLFYAGLLPQARELAAKAAAAGKQAEAARVNAFLDELLKRPEHQWLHASAQQ
ncbi:MAG: cytochrome c3 family protein [Magnetococcus sp. WYHC-3]